MNEKEGTALAVVGGREVDTPQVRALDAAVHAAPSLPQLDREKLDLLKRTICKGADDLEFEMFVARCNQTGLDPFSGQIHAVFRWDKSAQREVMSIQVGIDGLRLVADRTGDYVPGPDPTYEYDGQGNPVKATAYVKKWAHGEWHLVSDHAHWDEYAAYYVHKESRERKLTGLWAKMPHAMLAKCAESRALRRAFPHETSGLYTREEMGQADNPPADYEQQAAVKRDVTPQTPPAPRAAVEDPDKAERAALRREGVDHLKALGVEATVQKELSDVLLSGGKTATAPIEALRHWHAAVLAFGEADEVRAFVNRVLDERAAKEG